MTGDGLEGDVLVIDRGGRDERADHRGDPRRPHPGGVHDVLGRDPPLLGQDGCHLPFGRHLEAGHPNPGLDPNPERARGGRDRIRRPVRVEVAVSGEMDSAVQRLRRHGRHQPMGLIRADDAGIQADPPGATRGPLEFAKLLRA